jgi:hypothetical protein
MQFMFVILFWISGLNFFSLGQKDDIEMSALLSLKLVEITLEKQREFTHCLRQQNSSVLVTSLDQLLLGVGVRSRSSDSIAHIAT